MNTKFTIAGLSCVLLIVMLPVLGQAQRVLGGTVKDEKGKGIAYARIIVKNTTTGTVTDTTGHFSLKTKTAGPDTLVVSYLGYQTQKIPVTATGDQTDIGIGLKEVESTVNDVVITAGMIEASNESNVAVLKPLDIVTTAGGQGDIIGAIQTLPGVQRNGGDQTGLMVRGGDVSEASVIVDGTIAQNAFGSAVPGVSQRSRFNPFAFKGTAFSSGGYSVRYGQAMSSVLDLQTTDVVDKSNLNWTIMMAGLGISGAKKFNKSSLEFSAFYTNLSPFLLIVKPNVTFYAPPQGVALSGRYIAQTAKDKGMLKIGFQQSYNKTGIRIPNPALAGDKINFLIENNYTSFMASYQQWLKPTLKLFTAAAFSNNTDDISWGNFPVARDDYRVQGRGEVLWLPKTRLSLLVGTEVQQYRFLQKFDTLTGTFQELMPAGYVETQFKPKGWLGFKLGARAEYSTLLGRGNIAPRASAAVKTGEHSQVSLAGGYFYQSAQPQYLMQGYRPDFQHSIHALLNYQWMRNDRTLRLEAYYKKYDQLILENGVTYFPNQFRFYFGQVNNGGEGYAQGIDLFWRDRKSIKNFDYWISYSYIDTKRQYQNYPQLATPDYVSDHNLNVITKYWVDKLQLSINMSYNYASGRPYYDPRATEFLSGRAPDFHNLSLSAAYLRQIKKVFMVAFMGFDNMLNQKNVLGYRYSNDGLNRYPILPPIYRSLFIGFNFSLSKFNKDEL